MKQNVREVRARIPQSLKIAFEVACAKMETSQSEAMELAILQWLKSHRQPTAIAPIIQNTEAEHE